MDRINSLPVLLRNPRILLIGGGKVAYQKTRVLKENNIVFHVISKIFCEEILSLGVNFTQKEFESSDALDFNIIIDATGNFEVNFVLKKLKKERFFLLNTVDVPSECDFYFSSLLQYKNLKIAVSSDGASPTLTKIVRDKIKDIIPKSIGDLTEHKLIERINGIVDIEKTQEETQQIFGKVFLIGCGIGGAELLTIKAFKTIQTVDFVLYDHLITKEILEIVPSNVDKIYVGKCKGQHYASQDEINQLLLYYAKLGYRVARLKNGDPFVFGRGGEEADFLINNNINVEIIPGISSAFAAPLSAGIPVTMRGYSSEVSIVTAHKSGNEFNDTWIDLLKRKNHTTIVLMGLTQINNIVEHANKNGIDKFLPAAIISNAARENQKVIITTLHRLTDIDSNIEPPAVLVFGDVVKAVHVIPHFTNEKLFSHKTESAIQI